MEDQHTRGDFREGRTRLSDRGHRSSSVAQW